MIKIEGNRGERVILHAQNDECLKCKIAQLRERGVTVHSIDGKPVEGICEDCGLPVYEEQEYVCDNDGIYWHVGCDNPTEITNYKEVGEKFFADIASPTKTTVDAESSMIEPRFITKLFSAVVGPEVTNVIGMSDSMSENRGIRFSMDAAIEAAGIETVASNLTARLATDKELFTSDINRLAPEKFYGEPIEQRLERVVQVRGRMKDDYQFILYLEKALKYVNEKH